jgi:hypothetical protein
MWLAPLRSFVLGFGKAPLVPAATFLTLWFIATHISLDGAPWLGSVYFVIPVAALVLVIVISSVAVILSVVCRSDLERAGAVAAYSALAAFFFYDRFA